MGNSQDSAGVLSEDTLDENESGAAFLLMILRYMETPQYLRKSLFPMHNNLRFVVRILFLNHNMDVICGSVHNVQTNFSSDIT